MFSLSLRTLYQLSLILALGFSACSSRNGTPTSIPTPPLPTSTPVPPTPPTPPLAATVNGEIITRSEFEEELGRYQAAQEAQGKSVSETEARQIVLDDLVDQVLLAQAARAEGFELTEDGLQSRLEALAANSGGAEALARWMADHGYSEASFRLSLKRAAEAAWMRDKIVADVPASADQVHLQQILTYNEDAARQVLEKLNAGQDFNELAGLPIYDPVTRGELGWVPRGYLLDAKIEEAAFSLPVGSHSDVIATPAGFHIIKVLAHEKRPLSPDALLMMQEQALKEWIKQQRVNSQISIGP